MNPLSFWVETYHVYVTMFRDYLVIVLAATFSPKPLKG